MRDLAPWRGATLPGFGRDPFSSFRREMDRLFEDFFAPAEGRSFAPAQMMPGVMWPSVDVDENDQAYTVTAEMPGIDQKDIEIELNDNALTMRGEKRSERSEDEGGRHYSERTYGRYERTIPFAADIDSDRVEASCENGVLKIVLPKSAQARQKTRRIQIGNGQQMSGASGQQTSGQQTGGQQMGGQAGASGQGEAKPGAGM